MSVTQKFATSIFVLLMTLAGCDESGPGMMLTWKCFDENNEIWLEEIRLPSGLVQKRSTVINVRSAKTEGLAPDNRAIPDWVELSWIQPKYYWKDPNEPSVKAQLEEIHKLKRITQRVEVSRRIPPSVVAQALEAVHGLRDDELPKKYIWGYFTWREGAVSFRWELRERTADHGSRVIASGD